MHTFKKAKVAADNFIMLCTLVKPACTRSVKLFFISYSNVPKQHRCSVQEAVLEFSFQSSTVLFLSYTTKKKHLSYNTFIIKSMLYFLIYYLGNLNPKV